MLLVEGIRETWHIGKMCSVQHKSQLITCLLTHSLTSIPKDNSMQPRIQPCKNNNKKDCQTSKWQNYFSSLRLQDNISSIETEKARLIVYIAFSCGMGGEKGAVWGEATCEKKVKEKKMSVGSSENVCDSDSVSLTGARANIQLRGFTANSLLRAVIGSQ